MLPDEVVSQFDSLAKKAAAFFNISRSISNRLFSFSKRRIFSSISFRVTPPSATSSWSCRYLRTQREMFDESISDFNKVIEINPRHARAYINRAVVHFLTTDYDKAWNDAQKAKEFGYQINPDFLKDLCKTSWRASECKEPKQRI
ncbi:tetratricopeptide repeat protein [Thermodesulfobacteriota bacterium]